MNGRFPSPIAGFDIMVTQDQPRMQLGERVKEFLTAEQIADHNAWMMNFFGTVNLLKDGEVIVDKLSRVFHMNPRTLDNFRKATELP